MKIVSIENRFDSVWLIRSSSWSACSVCLTVALFTHQISSAIAQENQSLAKITERTDSLGDPLPERAILRLATQRFGHPEPVAGLAITPDGTSIISMGSQHVIAWQADSGKELWRVRTGELRIGNANLFGAAYGVQPLALMPDGKSFYTPYNSQDRIRCWLCSTGGQETLVVRTEFNGAGPYPGINKSIELSSDGSTLACGNASRLAVCKTDGEILFQINNATHENREDLKDSLLVGGSYCYGKFSPDGKTLAVSTSDAPAEILVVDAESGDELRRIRLTGRLVRMVFSADGKRIATTQRDRSVRFYDFDTGKELWSYRLDADEKAECFFSVVAFSPDRKTLAVGVPFAGDGRIRLLDVQTGEKVGTLAEYDLEPWNLVFSGDGKLLFSAGRDGAIRRWNVDQLEQINLIRGQRASVSCAASRDGRYLAYGDEQNGIHVVDAKHATEVRLISDDSVKRFSKLVFSPDSQTICAGGSSDNEINLRIWSLSDGKLIHTWNWEQGRDSLATVNDLNFSMEGEQIVAVVQRQSAARVFRLSDDQMIYEAAHPQISAASFSPFADRLATTGWDRNIRIWDPNRGRMVKRAKGDMSRNKTRSDDHRIFRVRYAPYGRSLATVTGNGTIALREIDTLLPKHQVSADVIVRQMEFSPCGAWIAVASENGVLQVRDTICGETVWEMQGHMSSIHSLSFGAGCRNLLSGGADGVCYLWDLRSDPADRALEKDDDLVEDEDQSFSEKYDRLVGLHARDAWLAMWEMAGQPEMAIKMIADRLDVRDEPLDEKTIDKLIEDLDSPVYRVRNNAEDELITYGGRIFNLLRKSLAKSESFEQQQRLRTVIGTIEVNGNNIEDARAIELLNLFDSQEAIDLLRKIHEQNPGSVEGRLAGQCHALKMTGRDALKLPYFEPRSGGM